MERRPLSGQGPLRAGANELQPAAHLLNAGSRGARERGFGLEKADTQSAWLIQRNSGVKRRGQAFGRAQAFGRQRT
jgi:hypothetical protein